MPMLWLFILALAFAQESYYELALRELSQIPQVNNSTRSRFLLDRYDHINNIQMVIPPMYYLSERRYNNVETKTLDAKRRQVLEYLQMGAAQNDLDCSYLLAELSIFGNHSFPKNASRALAQYTKVVENSSNASAAYMLGYLYATGNFGELEVSESKSVFYYELAAQLGDLRALMTLGFRHLYGINVEKSCETSLFYYSSVAKQLYDTVLRPRLHIGGPRIESFSVRINDFNRVDRTENKGATLSSFFGFPSEFAYKGVQDQDLTIERRAVDLVNDGLLNDFILDDEEYRYAQLYYRALLFYEGDYLQPTNYTKAFENVLECAVTGIKKKSLIFGDKQKRQASNAEKDSQHGLEAVEDQFINSCIGMVGHLYFRGEGVEQNYTEAYKWFQRMKTYNTDALVDMGLMYEFGLIDENKIASEEPEITTAGILKALMFYNKAEKTVRGSTSLARVYFNILRKREGYAMSKAMMQTHNIHETLAEKYLSRAARMKNIEALYMRATAAEALPEQNCASKVAFYKEFVEAVEPYVSDFEWSFQNLLLQRFGDALTGYSMAAEQGFERAQASAAALLYQKFSTIYELPESTPARLSQAAKYLKYSTRQGNGDSGVLLGDLYYYNLLNDTENHFEKAYQMYDIAGRLRSTQANWNLGYMYENGLGVERDFHLAKRHYDLTLIQNPKAYIPVQLSLLHLYLRMKIYPLLGWDTTSAPGVQLAPLWQKLGLKAPTLDTMPVSDGTLVEFDSKSKSPQREFAEKLQQLVDALEMHDANELDTESYDPYYLGVMIFGLVTSWLVMFYTRRVGNAQRNEAGDPQQIGHAPRVQAFFMVVPL